MKQQIALAAALLAALPFAAVAQQASTAQSRVAQSQIEHSQDERLAHEWGLRTEEWARYQQLMQGPLGIYSPNLDPLSALGVEARSDEERRRYAELQVQAEARRVEKLLAYQRAYDDAWQRLQPGAQRVNLPDASSGRASSPANISREATSQPQARRRQRRCSTGLGSMWGVGSMGTLGSAAATSVGKSALFDIGQLLGDMLNGAEIQLGLIPLPIADQQLLQLLVALHLQPFKYLI